jgi:hypothetical protein
MDGKTYSMLQQTTISGIVSQTTWVYTFVDPCKTTSFVTQTLSNVDYNIGAVGLIVTLPSLSDTVSTTYGSAVCYTQSLVATSGGLALPYATLSGNLLTVQTNNVAYAGTKTIDVLYSLTRYPTI